MILSAIVAIDRNGLIGNGGRLPWHLPRDLRRFRKHTLGKPIIMGRRTFASLPGPLDGRLNIVLTHGSLPDAPGVAVARSIDEALQAAEAYRAEHGGDEAMIIGGSDVFAATCARWDRLLLTFVEGTFTGDTFMPLKPVTALRWRLVSQERCDADAKNPYPNWFLWLERQPADATTQPDFDLAAWLAGR